MNLAFTILLMSNIAIAKPRGPWSIDIEASGRIQRSADLVESPMKSSESGRSDSEPGPDAISEDQECKCNRFICLGNPEKAPKKRGSDEKETQPPNCTCACHDISVVDRNFGGERIQFFPASRAASNFNHGDISISINSDGNVSMGQMDEEDKKAFDEEMANWKREFNEDMKTFNEDMKTFNEDMQDFERFWLKM